MKAKEIDSKKLENLTQRLDHMVPDQRKEEK